MLAAVSMAVLFRQFAIVGDVLHVKRVCAETPDAGARTNQASKQIGTIARGKAGKEKDSMGESKWSGPERQAETGKKIRDCVVLSHAAARSSSSLKAKRLPLVTVPCCHPQTPLDKEYSRVGTAVGLGGRKAQVPQCAGTPGKPREAHSLRAKE
ncbi:hypothetical protein NDU88_000657 [Pleurodeles waltl]|uniref:Secreted protein n=1 Tax=Pleurodeles waltl TaxID=8319 RepID=A0AAV7S7L7_PLEWA|nr:hypothetical protein NDU88_000657 [Pleurodeles waltl]